MSKEKENSQESGRAAEQIKEEVESYTAIDERAYKLDNLYLTVQVVPEGYDFIIYDNEYKEINSGIYDNAGVEIETAITGIRQHYGIEDGELEQINYGEFEDIIWHLSLERLKEKPVTMTSEIGRREPGLHGWSRADVEYAVAEHASNVLEEMGYSSDQVQINGVRVYGSRMREGFYREDSDLNVAVSYTGTIPEETFSAALNEAHHKVEGIPLNMKPVPIEKTSLHEFMEGAERYLDEKAAEKERTVHKNKLEPKVDAPEALPEEKLDIEEILKILVDQNQEQNAQTVQLLATYISEMESNFHEVLGELEGVKGQLNQIQAAPKEKVQQAVTMLDSQIKAQISILQGIRENFNERAARLLQNFKEHGTVALNHVCEFLGIKESMERMRDSLLQSAESMQVSIDKINSVSREVRETVTHAKNVGRAVANRELVAVPLEKEGDFFNRLKSPYQKMKGFCDCQADKLEKTITRLGTMGKAAQQVVEKHQEKASIRGKLSELKEKHGDRDSSDLPEDKRKKHIAEID